MTRSVALLSLCCACALPDPPQLPQAQAQGELLVSPESCDLGTVALGDTATCELTLENTGDDASPVTFSFSDPLFSLEDTPEAIEGLVAVTVQATPNAFGQFFGDLNIATDEQEFVVPLAVAGACAPGLARIRIKSVNGVSVAEDAAPPVHPFDVVVLSADDSEPCHADETITSFSWTLSARPVGSNVALFTPAAVDTGLEVDAVGTYQLDIVVGSSGGASATTSFELVVEPPWPSFVVQASTGDASADLDVRIARGDPPAWCVGELARDDVAEDVGRETFNAAELAPGTYTIAIASTDATTATVKVFIGNSLVSELFSSLDDPFVEVARIGVDENSASFLSELHVGSADPCSP